MITYPATSRIPAGVSWAEEHDFVQIAAITNHSIKSSANSFDGRTLNAAEWQAKWQNERYPLLLHREGANVLGVAYGGPFMASSGYDWTARLYVFVVPDAPDCGVAQGLYLQLVRLLAGQGYRSLISLVTMPDPGLVAVHRGLGFVPSGLLPAIGYKHGAWRDQTLEYLTLPKPGTDQPLWPPFSMPALKAQPVQVNLEQPDHPDIQLFIRTLDDFHDQLYPPEHNYQESSESLTESDSSVFIARKGLLAVGMAALKPDDEAQYGELKRMYVCPLFRGQGVGVALLNTVESEARKRGLKELKLETGDKQTPAIKLYERHGFRRCAAFGDYEDHGTNVFMTKPLA